MQIPQLTPPAAVRHTLDTFAGYHHAPRIGDNEFAFEENLTADHHPVLAPRRGRRLQTAARAGALLEKDSLCWTDGPNFVVSGYPVDLGLTPGDKQLVSMGAYVVIFPDKKYINTLDLTEFGSLEAYFSTDEAVAITPCDQAGNPLTPTAGEEAPDPAASPLWLDTAQAVPVLRRYDSLNQVWIDEQTPYLRLDAPGIGRDFRELDGVQIDGLPEDYWNGSRVIWRRGEDYLVLYGLTGAPASAPGITLSRCLPEMDFVISAGNRLWGCRYGLEDGQPVNRIYASKLGDFRNWQCYLGISTDSFALALGDDGPFTGGICFRGQPLFFRENCLHRIYGATPDTFRLQTTDCPGVERGSHRSLALVGQSLYYKSAAGICVYDGSLPAPASRALGQQVFKNACAGAYGEKYFVSMEDEAGSKHLFVLDTARKLWHRESDPGFTAFCPCRDTLFAASAEGIWDLFGDEETVSWVAQTGKWDIGTPEMPYTTRLTANFSLEAGATLSIYARSDGGPWQLLMRRTAHRDQSYSVPIRPRRCRTLELRLEGTGQARVFSLSRTVEKGSELP